MTRGKIRVGGTWFLVLIRNSVKKHETRVFDENAKAADTI